MSSVAHTGIGQLGNHKLRIHGGRIRVGGKISPSNEAAVYHETGHVVHAQALFGGATLPQHLTHKFSGASHGVDQYKDESIAWKLADPFISKMPTKGKQPIARWTKAYALSTYRHGLKVTKSGEVFSLKGM